MLYTMKDLLDVAMEEQFAVPAFNISSYDMLKTVVETAEEMNAPVIIEIHPDEIEYLGDEFIASVLEFVNKSSVPIVVHLDHGENLFDIMRAVKNGYTSVMIDASSQSFEENVRITKEVVDLVSPLGISVEAELGTIGDSQDEENEIIYTDPALAKEFVKLTGVDTLAIAIGTAHGKYPPNKTPKLNLELLEILNDELGIPLVLHGGSGNKEEEIRESLKHGICKVNISTDIKTVFFETVREVLNNKNLYEPSQIYPIANESVKKVIIDKFKLLDTVGKAKNYQ